VNEEIGCEDMNQIDTAQDTVQWWDFVISVMNLWVQQQHALPLSTQ
jgi:hypothetical protein